MAIGEALRVTNAGEWRTWLSRNHRRKDEIWLVVTKTGAGKPRITLNEAVEEAICFGWIDSRIKSIDQAESAIRFTPRRNVGNWSKYNVARALKLLSEEKMTKAGMAVLPHAVIETWEKRKRIPRKVDPRHGIVSYD